jgi:defect in organelle trafficking protein DotC
MRLFPAVNLFIAACALLAASSLPALAQETTSEATERARKVAEALNAQVLAQQQLQQQQALAAGGMPAFLPGVEKKSEMTDAELQRLLSDPDSPQYHAHVLAAESKRERDLHKTTEHMEVDAASDTLTDGPVPAEVEKLQDINTAMKGRTSIADDPVTKEITVDMRRDAQKDAALSYGARGGLAKRNYQIMERLADYEGVLSQVFNFRQLLIKAPSGLLIEPPIVRESLDSLVIADDGNEAAVADRVLDINKQAKIVSAPRDWRQYLIQSWAEVPPPPRILWPKSKEEQAGWDDWVEQGWKAGIVQAEQMFEMNVNRLVADYNGMVRYRMLLAEGMISQPYALHEDRGVTGSKTEMRVGDRALRITGPSQFLTGAALWKPADR